VGFYCLGFEAHVCIYLLFNFPQAGVLPGGNSDSKYRHKFSLVYTLYITLLSITLCLGESIILDKPSYFVNEATSMWNRYVLTIEILIMLCSVLKVMRRHIHPPKMAEEMHGKY
jgi:hypothetical protein